MALRDWIWGGGSKMEVMCLEWKQVRRTLTKKGTTLGRSKKVFIFPRRGPQLDNADSSRRTLRPNMLAELHGARDFPHEHRQAHGLALGLPRAGQSRERGLAGAPQILLRDRTTGRSSGPRSWDNCALVVVVCSLAARDHVPMPAMPENCVRFKHPSPQQTEQFSMLNTTSKTPGKETMVSVQSTGRIWLCFNG